MAEEKQKGEGCFKVSAELLIELLNLPKGTKILIGEWLSLNEQLKLWVEAPGLPVRKSGERPVDVNPVVRRIADGHIEFVSWGI